MRALIKIVIVLAIVAGIGFGAVKWWASRAVALTAQPTTVRVEAVLKGTLVETISAPGEVEPKTKVAISARVTARIAELPVKEGMVVTKGDPAADPPVKPSLLVKLDARELEAALKSVQARQAAEEAQLTVSTSRIASTKLRLFSLKVGVADAKRELDRNLRLLESKDVSQQTVDQLQGKYDQQRSEYAAAEESLRADDASLLVLRHNIAAAAAEIDKAKDNLSYAVIHAPIDGTVTRVASEVGELTMMGTMNNAGTVIMEVSDLSQMVVKARVDENAITQVKEGQKCKIRMEAYRDRVFEGKVTNVALANFDPQYSRGGSNSRSGGMDSGRFFKVEVLIDSKGERIFSGLSADVEIQIAEHIGVLKVPSQAVLGRAPDSLPADVRTSPEVDTSKATVPVVFRYVDGQTVVTPVAIGATDNTHTVIKSGLSESDLIVTGPYKVLESVQHGQKYARDTAATNPASKPTSAPATTQATQPTTRSTTRPSTEKATSP